MRMILELMIVFRGRYFALMRRTNGLLCRIGLRIGFQTAKLTLYTFQYERCILLHVLVTARIGTVPWSLLLSDTLLYFIDITNVGGDIHNTRQSNSFVSQLKSVKRMRLHVDSLALFSCY